MIALILIFMALFWKKIFVFVANNTPNYIGTENVLFFLEGQRVSGFFLILALISIILQIRRKNGRSGN